LKTICDYLQKSAAKKHAKSECYLFCYLEGG